MAKIVLEDYSIRSAVLSVHGVAVAWMSYHSSWNVGVFPLGQTITTDVVALFTRDWFLTLGSLANLAALAMRTARTMGGPFRPSTSG